MEGGSVGQSIQSCRSPLPPQVDSPRSAQDRRRRFEPVTVGGEMKAKVDKGRVKGIDSGGMQGKCDR